MSYFELAQEKTLLTTNIIEENTHKINNTHTDICTSIGDVFPTPFGNFESYHQCISLQTI
jgi:hypothetical protein